MITPQYLKPGSILGITCPSGYVSDERVAYAISILERRGFVVKRGKTIGSEHFYFSGTDEERADDLQRMLDDPGMDAILMGRGGYGMSRIIDRLNFTAFIKHPKWVCGFSDITVLHNHLLARFGIASLHSPMCGAFKPETDHAPYLETFFSALTGAPLVYHTPPCSGNREGNTEGVLTGGNLSLITHLIGSASDVTTDGKILFLEDIGEHLYKIDRMMLTLKRAGKLDNLVGLVLGGFTEMEDTERPFGQTLEELIGDKVSEFDYPVCFHFPAGHQEINHTLTLGERHKLSVTASGSVLELVR